MSKENILILDGEANTQWTLKALLEDEGYSVIAVDAIDQALGKFQEAELCGLITEYRIGQTTTLEIIREFKKYFPAAYVMILSNGEIPENEYEKILNAGTDDFFQKPVSLKKVLLHLQKGLKQRLSLIAKNDLTDQLNGPACGGENREEVKTPVKTALQPRSR